MQQSLKPLVEKQLAVENTFCSSYILYLFKQTVLKHSYRSETKLQLYLKNFDNPSVMMVVTT